MKWSILLFVIFGVGTALGCTPPPKRSDPVLAKTTSNTFPGMKETLTTQDPIWTGEFMYGTWHEGELQLKFGKTPSFTYSEADEEDVREYSGDIVSHKVSGDRITIHCKATEMRDSGWDTANAKDYDTGWHGFDGTYDLHLEGTLLPTAPNKVYAIVGTISRVDKPGEDGTFLYFDDEGPEADEEELRREDELTNKGTFILYRFHPPTKDE